MNKRVSISIFVILVVILIITMISTYSFNGKKSYSYVSNNDIKTSDNKNVDKLFDLFKKITKNFENKKIEENNESSEKEKETNVQKKKSVTSKKESTNKNVKETPDDNKTNEVNNEKQNEIVEVPNNEVNSNNIKDDEIKEETKVVEKEEETSNVTVVNKEIIKEDEESNYKYGIKLITTTTYEVTTYSDGKVDKVSKNTSKKYDKSGYNATTSDLKSEASSIVQKNNEVYNEILNYTNEYRKEIEKENLSLDNNLSIAATIRAMEMAYSNKFSHTRPNGKLWYTVCSESGTSCYAENIASGQKNAKSVTTSWKNSSGHYANMTNESYTKLGVGKFELDGSIYWVQLFR